MANEAAIEEIQRTRLNRAVRCLAFGMAVGLAVLFGCQGIGLESRDQALSLGGASLISSLIRDAGASTPELLRRAGFVTPNDADVPPWFAEELFDPVSVDEMIAVEDWSLVRCAWKGSGGPSRSSLEEQLSACGWVAVSGADAPQRTFTKPKGRCRWVVIAYVETEGELSVVMHIQHD